MRNPDAVPKDSFLRGRIVTLCIPDVEADVVNGEWHSWFNDLDVTQFLEHGVTPISAAEEAEIVTSDLRHPGALLLSIRLNSDGTLIGVISLKSISHLHRRAEIAMVTSPRRVPGAALEAIALLAQHGFDRMNLEKIFAGQHEGLWRWVNVLGTIGFRIEGMRRRNGFRNGRPYDAVLTGITAEDFYAIRDARGGDVLAGDAAAMAATRIDRNMVEEVRTALERLNRVYG